MDSSSMGNQMKANSVHFLAIIGKTNDGDLGSILFNQRKNFLDIQQLASLTLFHNTNWITLLGTHISQRHENFKNTKVRDQNKVSFKK